MPPRKKADEKEKEKPVATEKAQKPGSRKAEDREKGGERERERKVGAGEAVELVGGYLREQNRPYSAIDVSANLHNKVTKAAAVKILKDLHEKGEIEGRVSGKQIVYHAIQNPDDSLSPEQLSSLDAQTSDLRTQTTHLHATAKSLRHTLTNLSSTLSTATLHTTIATLESEKVALAARLEALRKGAVKKVGKREREEVEGAWALWRGVAKRRRGVEEGMWRDIVGWVGEGEAGEVRERLGLDE